jgi:hypothetical protein
VNRRGFLASAASVIVSPLAAAVVTTKTVVTNSAWTDLGAGPMLLSFTGDGVYAIGDTTPSLTEGFSIKKGASHALSTTSHVWVRATSSSGVSVYATGIASGGGGSTSVWSAADAAANGMTLSNGGLTVTNPAAATYATVRGMISRTTGKYYVEFYTPTGATGSASDIMFGLADASFTPTPGTYLGHVIYSAGCDNGGGNFVSSGFTSVNVMSVTPAASSDVFAIAVDLAAGKFWVAYNNVWFASGNPGAGANPMVTIASPALGLALFPGLTTQGVNGGSWTLQATAASQKYAPPAGFTPWG